jgi:N utilization substance protein A
MRNDELLHLVDSIHREKGISKDLLFEAIEQALLSAASKRWAMRGQLSVRINRLNGEVEAYEDGRKADPNKFGRIPAQTAKQIMIQKIREAERDVIFSDYERRIDTLVNGTIQRFERGSILIHMGRTEGILPRQEQVFNENYRLGSHLRAYVVKVQKKGQKVMIVLSRTHPNLVKELFALEVPEIGDRIVEIKGLAREPGQRTKIAVYSADPKVDAIGACVGVRGARIRGIVEELNGEKIDIVRWSEEPDLFIRNALSPAEISAVELDRETRHARVIVPDDQLSLAIGKKGQNVRLTAKLTQWHIDITTEEQARKLRDADRVELFKIPDLPEGLAEKLVLGGIQSLRQLVQKGAEHLAVMYSVEDEKAQEIVRYAEGRQQEVEKEREAAVLAEKTTNNAPPAEQSTEAQPPGVVETETSATTEQSADKEAPVVEAQTKEENP